MAAAISMVDMLRGFWDPERSRHFIVSKAPVGIRAGGSYLSDAKPIDFAADLPEVGGKPVAKRGRLPGITPNPRVRRIL
jgi:nicotinate phosphoribosyltransferase